MSVGVRVRAKVTGVGCALPTQVVPNSILEQRLGLSPGWIERTGIRERRVLDEGTTLVDLAERAARDALRSAGISSSTVDAVVVATTSSAYLFPSLACLVHERLELDAQPAFDVAAACAGFPYALSIANDAICARRHDTVLVIGADSLSSFVDPTDRTTSTLFGDGAGAVVLSARFADADAPAARDSGILNCRLRARGKLWPILQLPMGPRRPDDFAAQSTFWMRMNGPEVFREAVAQLVDLTRQSLQDIDLAPADIDLVIPHQANARIIRAMLHLLGIEESRALINLDRYGNTSAASIPIALAEALASQRLSEGDLVLLNAVGGGLTAGVAIIRW